MSSDPRTAPVAIIGAGAAGLITAYTLLQDGFSRVQIITRDPSVGGVWAPERVYPGLQINNVHGEYGFSALEMPPPVDGGGRLTGRDLCAYMQAFSNKFLKSVIRLDTEVINIRRDEHTFIWHIIVEDRKTKSREILQFSRVVLCTGGCNTPNVPKSFTRPATQDAGFLGLVIHSQDFGSQLGTILDAVPPIQSRAAKSIVVIGGGKSAEDISAYLANEGRKVAVVSEKLDAFLASAKALPAFIRRSRHVIMLLSILASNNVLQSRLERFLHTTWFGSKITHYFWDWLSRQSLQALSVTQDSPLHNIRSLFWSTGVTDEGTPRQNGFHALANSGKIEVIVPARVQGFGVDGRSLILSDGRTIEADVIVLATGYSSSWSSIFDENTFQRLGMNRHPRGLISTNTTTSQRPKESDQWAAKNILRRDFAINGAVFTTNAGFTWEVVSHWISSYFLEDNMKLPKTPEEAYHHADRDAAWIRKRFPDVHTRVNESYSSFIAFWTWPQYTDQLLEEMGLPSMRSGGNWFTWPFKVIELKEISTLGEERRQKRALGTSS
ncbi:FAD/NAD-P-binding domain-containing protein [Mycena sp. CBHHK59/15]|nr:FAD/NAD-P-binding domain-containing protein [Mycena sp. CBHHK59/15]